MCIGVPRRLEAVQGSYGRYRVGDREEQVDLSLVGEVAPGSWVLVFLNTAREVLDPRRAQQINAALVALEAAMNGQQVPDGFIDLTQHAPQLPPHLEQARLRGDKQG